MDKISEQLGKNMKRIRAQKECRKAILREL